MVDIDQGKMTKLQEAASWLRQAEAYYRQLQYQFGDDCIRKAKGALADPIFDRQPIAGFARNQQPEVVRIVAENPLGYAIINGSDFDESLHRLYVEQTLPTTKRSKAG